MLHLEAHALLVDAHLAFDTGAALGLLQAKVVLPRSLFRVFLRTTGLIDLILPPALLRLAGGALGGLPRLALGFRLGAGSILLLLDAIVFDPSQLAQRKQDRVLTWTLTATHGRGLTIPVTRLSVDFNATSIR
ncbi:MAG TPA: hypothetical protein VIQ54_18695 [Polyangia bacterium]